MKELFEAYITIYTALLSYSQFIFPATIGVLLFSNLTVDMLSWQRSNGVDMGELLDADKRLELLRAIFGIGAFLGYITGVVWVIMAILFAGQALNIHDDIVLTGDVGNSRGTIGDIIIGTSIFAGSGLIYLYLVVLCHRMSRSLFKDFKLKLFSSSAERAS